VTERRAGIEGDLGTKGTAISAKASRGSSDLNPSDIPTAASNGIAVVPDYPWEDIGIRIP
jgi:hypothetical protein